MVSFKKLESLGGIGSILTGFLCVWIGWMDFTTGQSWHIWAVMTVVLIVNGVLMLIAASKRVDKPLEIPVTKHISRVRS
jgi:uncharacterized membrane protein YhhN